jgi:hypothetical protein
MIVNHRNFSAAALVILALNGMAFAQSKAEDHSAHHPAASASAASMVAPSAATSPAMGASKGMHAHMEKHHADMQRIMKIRDFKKRQDAMNEHMKAMKEGDCPMMKDGMGMGPASGTKK